MAVRVALVHQNGMLSDALRAVLSGLSAIDLVGEATGTRAGGRLARSVHPDAVVVDVGVPGSGAIVGARTLVAASLRILIVADGCDTRCLSHAFHAGILGFVLRSDPASILVEAVERVARGEHYASPSACIPLTCAGEA